MTNFTVKQVFCEHVYTGYDRLATIEAENGGYAPIVTVEMGLAGVTLNLSLDPDDAFRLGKVLQDAAKAADPMAGEDKSITHSGL